jgi:murein DD-endopeptidase MepM/ murein hydrolase activator NlpD
MLPVTPAIPAERVEPIEGGRIPQGGAGAWLASRSDGARLHAGVDIAATMSTPMRAPESGVVRVVGDAARPADVARGDRHSRPAGWVGYGPRLVLLEGDSGWWHLLAHLDTVHVREGDRVRAGDVVATGSALHHLHYEVRRVARPPAGWAVVEIVVHPGRWLAGEVVVYDGRCPPAPDDSTRTPRACRPGRGAAGGGGSVPPR